MAKKSRTKKPGNKPFTSIAIVVFGLVAFVHLLRLLLDWYVVVAGVSIPMWVSVLGFVVPAGLAVMLWRELRD
ncbi:MAG: hypothetical protein HY942_07355 [Gammaproteobacteria bacterium]|nr:hypothetical protein [Gammaproteobacteria bacterium]